MHEVISLLQQSLFKSRQTATYEDLILHWGYRRNRIGLHLKVIKFVRRSIITSYWCLFFIHFFQLCLDHPVIHVETSHILWTQPCLMIKRPLFQLVLPGKLQYVRNQTLWAPGVCRVKTFHRKMTKTIRIVSDARSNQQLETEHTEHVLRVLHALLGCKAFLKNKLKTLSNSKSSMWLFE